MGDAPKTINSLMRYLRDDKGIAISGTSQKRALMNMGYYHGYKGYRYINRPTNLVNYTDFAQLKAVYDFDTKLKSLFYPSVMFIETAVKNYALDIIISLAKSGSFADIYNKLLDNYKAFSTVGKMFKNDQERSKAEARFSRELKKRLDLQNRIYRVQTEAFGNENKIAVHYLRKDENLPIWAIFELLSLGEFGYFVSCLNRRSRTRLSVKLGIRQSDDTQALMPQRLIYATKDLRNAIAHNDVVFDTRFRTSDINRQVGNAITNATGVKNVTFNSITDYLVLLIYQMKLLQAPKEQMRRMLADYKMIVEEFRKKLPIQVFNQVIYTDNNAKITVLEKFISS